MTEPQPWPTTTQRRRESGTAGAASDVPVSGIATSDVPEPDARESDTRESDVSTPRHGHPADAPAAARAPSPFPRQRDAPRAAPQTYFPAPQEPAHSRPTHVRDVVGPRHPEPHTGTSRADGARAAAPSAPASPAVPAVRRDGAAMTTLRVITYVLVSLASLAFLAIVVYGGIKAVQLRDELATSPFGALTGSSASPTAGG